MAAFTAKQPYWAFINRHVHKNGQTLWLETSGLPLIDEKGNLLGYRGVDTNITGRRQIEEEKTELEAQLRQAQRMESVGRLAGGVAHGFNNMLGVILGRTEMALEKVDPAQPLCADLAEIRDAAKRSADLTRQLLTFAHKQIIAPKVLDLNDTVTGMLKMLPRLIGENIQLNWRPGAALWPVKVDPAQVDQILANLCINARDAIAGAGRITIETGNITFDEDYCVVHKEYSSGDYVMLCVSDNGCGMDKATLGNIFDPFFTTKEMDPETGLGLPSVYGAVKQNNGFIKVYSEPGQGTTFRIYLPRHAGKAEQAEVKGSRDQIVRGGEIILLVDDEPALAKMAARMLTGLGYIVLQASTPGEAIRLAGEHAGAIDILLTDVIMPEMNGWDLAQNLLSLYPDLKRLFMSGYTADAIDHHGLLQNEVHFIQKPFSKADLASKIRQVLEA
jgi:signal transduction histidine kinase